MVPFTMESVPTLMPAPGDWMPCSSMFWSCAFDVVPNRAAPERETASAVIRRVRDLFIRQAPHGEVLAAYFF